MPKRETAAARRARRLRQLGAGLYEIRTGGQCCPRHGTFERTTQTSRPNPIREYCWNGLLDWADEVERRS